MGDTNKNIYFADLFAGIGGFHHAFKIVASDLNLKIKCKYVSEIDKYAKENYCLNFNFDENKIFDIKDFTDYVDNSNLDIVFCGFPCQPFSNAGFMKGFDDEHRGKMIYIVCDFIKKTKPKIILLENVKYLTKHNNENTYKEILDMFHQAGYVGSSIKEPLIISPHDLGLKQKRERVFIPLVQKSFFNKVTSNNENYWNMIH